PLPGCTGLTPDGAEIFPAGSRFDPILPGRGRLGFRSNATELSPLPHLSTEFGSLPTGFGVQGVQGRFSLAHGKVDDESHILSDIGHLFVLALVTVPDGIRVGVEGELDGDLVEPVPEILAGLHIPDDPVTRVQGPVTDLDLLGDLNDPVAAPGDPVLLYRDDPLDRPRRDLQGELRLQPPVRLNVLLPLKRNLGVLPPVHSLSKRVESSAQGSGGRGSGCAL